LVWAEPWAAVRVPGEVEQPAAPLVQQDEAEPSAVAQVRGEAQHSARVVQPAERQRLAGVERREWAARPDEAPLWGVA
jgi:hypothetical protein